MSVDGLACSRGTRMRGRFDRSLRWSDRTNIEQDVHTDQVGHKEEDVLLFVEGLVDLLDCFADTKSSSTSFHMTIGLGRRTHLVC